MVEVLTQARDAGGIELVEPAGAVLGVSDESGIFENAQMLRNGGAADGQGLSQFVDGDGSGSELLKDGHACGITERVEAGLKVSIH